VTTVIRAPASLKPLYFLGILGFIGYQVVNIRPETFSLLLAGNLVAALALFPMGLWCFGRVAGLPLFPLLAMMYVPTFALPLLEPSREVAKYPVELRLAAAGVASAFLVLATVVWWVVTRRVAAPARYWAFRGERNSGLFVACVFLGDAFLLANNARWLPDLAPGAFAILRGVCVGLSILGTMVLAYRAGIRRLGRSTLATFMTLFGAYMVLSAASLTIIGAITSFLAAIAMFAIGRGKLPVGIIVLVVAAFAILHAGKHPMRAKYWDRSSALEPAAYPAFYADWVGYGVNNLVPGSVEDRRAKETASLAERSSLLQILLLVLDKTAKGTPLLNGETYAIVPELMVPRILLEDKLLVHEGTTILNVHFGRQRREDTKRTTIGFGHLSEAYANFGWFGVVGLAIGTGGLLGFVTRWSAGVPIDSFRGLCSLLFLGLSIQTEHTMGVTAASLSQGLQLLVVVAIFFMEPKQAEAAE
jgi:hypothetical protein